MSEVSDAASAAAASANFLLSCNSMSKEPGSTLEENAALIADLELSTMIVAIVVTLALWLFFRAARATAALVMALFVGTFWTFGVSYFLVGYLNANSAFLGSIVLGNGINFGIIFLARYLEERRRGEAGDTSIETAMVNTATSTWTAALAAGLSYGSLILTGFRGFRQFGVIGLVGMVLCWTASFTLMPALLTVFERFKPLVKPGVAPGHFFTTAIAWAVEKAPKAIWITALVFTLISAASFSRFSPNANPPGSIAWAWRRLWTAPTAPLSRCSPTTASATTATVCPIRHRPRAGRNSPPASSQRQVFSLFVGMGARAAAAPELASSSVFGRVRRGSDHEFGSLIQLRPRRHGFLALRRNGCQGSGGSGTGLFFGVWEGATRQ